MNYLKQSGIAHLSWY